MSIFGRLLNSKGSEKDGNATASVRVESGLLPSSLRPLIITRELLEQLFPVRNCDAETLDVFASDRVAEVCGKGSILFRRGEPVESIIYVLEGAVRMEIPDAGDYEVRAGTAKANFPLTSGTLHSATAHALTDLQLIRVSPRIMSGTAETATEQAASLDPHADDLPPSLKTSQLFQAFCESFLEDSLMIPTMPNIAKRLREAMAKDVGLREMVKIIHLDPVIAARLVHVANSPLFMPPQPITSCLDAVQRLGLNAARNLVIGLSLRHVFDCQRPDVRRLMQTSWRHSIYLSSLCYVLASENKGVDPSEALLAGLVAHIGTVPFLCFAEKVPADFYQPNELEAALGVVRATVGTRILRDWGFPDELVEVPTVIEDWYLDRGEALTLADIVILSNLHACIGTPRMASVPAINAIPACGKLRDDALSPEHSLAVLHNAKDRINVAMKFFEA